MDDAEQRLKDAVFEPVLTPERLRRTISARDIEREGGLPAAEVIAMVRGFGLPLDDPDEPWFTPEEAEVFKQLAELWELWPRDIYLQVSRVYGQALATIAHTEVQSLRRRIAFEFEAAAEGADPAALRALREGMEALVPLADPILTGVHRRWVEHELAQASVFEAEERTAEGLVPGAVHVALLFVDIKNFTAYVDTAGDTAAVAAIEEFDRVVLRERGETGHVVKALGDGFMLAYPSAVDAVAAGHRMLRQMPSEYGPSIHASVHEGPAVFRGGDYFGRTVNLAARLLGLSGSTELLATSTVVRSTSGSFEWEPRVTTHIRGFREPIELCRLVGPA